MSSSNDSALITELKHVPSGASCKIHALGATLLSYQNGHGDELLFVSRDAKLDGTKAIRGGIPLVFPIFGPPPPPSDDDEGPSNTMPQHGFARNNRWTPTAGSIVQTDDSASISYHLELHDVTESRGTNNPWESNALYNVRLELTVTITADTLTTTLQIHNTGHHDFAFQALFHTYYSVANHAALDPHQCFVKGLEGYRVYDQVAQKAFVLGSEPVTVQGELDHIHTPPPVVDQQPAPVAKVVHIGVGNHRTVSLSCHGSVDGSDTPISFVVWNPHQHKAASLNDFGNDQYLDMICVEPGILSRPVLPAGKVAELQQVIRMEE